MDDSSWFGALFLGIIQGLTEFLPVSSSGHLTLFEPLIGHVGSERLLFNLVLHVGTLIPVLFFYREHVKQLVVGPFSEPGGFGQRPAVRLWIWLIAASVPTAMIGLLFKDLFESLFATPASLIAPFVITGCLLWFAAARPGSGERQLSVPIAVLLGVAQGLAITPGISRSGTTIAVALMLGLEREEAARFSFLMSVPAIVGGLLLEAKDAQLSAIDPIQFGIGGIAAMLTGYFALSWLVALVKNGGFRHFAWWVWAMAIFAGVLAYTGYGA